MGHRASQTTGDGCVRKLGTCPSPATCCPAWLADFSDIAFGLSKCLTCSDAGREDVTTAIQAALGRKHSLVTLSVR